MKRLRNSLDSSDKREQKEAAKRVVSFMRAGENMGSLFSSMLRCVRTDDLEQKKLTYLYLTTYFNQEPEQSIMAVNTFVKDASDPNPVVRALAVRTMCRIKLDTVAEHMIEPLKRCLSDKDPYVRKTAAMAVSKLYDVIPEAVENARLVENLQTCLKDDNPMVVSNATAALLEINDRRSTPAFTFDKHNIQPVLNAMVNTSEWVQTILLDALSHYKPKTQKEASNLIDRLTPFLKNASASVVVGAFKCIYLFMDKDGRHPSDLFPLIMPPFISLISSAETEVQYVVLRTLALFVKRYPKALVKETRVFFCKYNDPCYIKLEKLDIMVSIAIPNNAEIMLNEFEEYCNAVDVAFVRKTIDCLGQLAIKIEPAARRCVDILVKLVQSKAEYAVEEAVCVVTDLLRKFPGHFESIISIVCAHIESLKESQSKAAVIWILGEYCNLIENVDVLLDPFLDSFNDEAPEVQMQLLTALIKIYIKNGEKTQDQLQYILNEATKETIVPDVRSRAMIYWRLLSTADLESQERAMCFEKSTIINTAHNYDKDVLKVLITNIGNVSGVLHIAPSDFVARVRYLPEAEEEEEAYEPKDWMRCQIKDDDNLFDIYSNWEKQTLWLKFVNKSQTPIGEFAVAINRNCLGFTMSSLPSFPSALDFGEAFETQISLSTNPNAISNTNNIYLQCALKTSAGMRYFTLPIDLGEVTVQIPVFDEIEFNRHWNEIPNEVKTVIHQSTFAEASTFKKRHMVVVTQRKTSAHIAFGLPPNNVYLAKVYQKEENLEVVVHGAPIYLDIIHDGASFLFC